MVPVAGLLRESSPHDLFQPARRGWWLLEVGEEDRGFGAARVRGAAGEALVQQAREGVLVGRDRRRPCPRSARVRRRQVFQVTARLRIPVPGRDDAESPKSARYAWPRSSRRTFDGFTSRCTSPRACAASSASASCPQIVTTRRGSSDPRSASELLQVAAVGQSHGEVQLTVDFAGVVDRNDVGMLERRRALGLAQEALAKALVGRVFGCEQLEGNVALQSRVVGAVDDTHPTAAEDGLEPVPQAGRCRAVGHWRPPRVRSVRL